MAVAHSEESRKHKPITLVNIFYYILDKRVHEEHNISTFARITTKKSDPPSLFSYLLEFLSKYYAGKCHPENLCVKPQRTVL